ncbi:MAG: DNA-processing protein DprA, partial [Cyanobacteria bacterium J06649_11]
MCLFLYFCVGGTIQLLTLTNAKCVLSLTAYFLSVISIMHHDTFFRVALSRVPKVGPVVSRLLYDHFGIARAIFEARNKELKQIEGVGEGTIKRLKASEPLVEAEQILAHAERYGVNIVHYTDVDYPLRLKQQYAAPALFYYRGNAALHPKRSVAIIGTRQASHRGIAQTELLLAGLQTYEPLIISGLAYGIDICAHRIALKQGLPTIGVLGSGLNHIYPAAHLSTAREMLDNGGLLTMYPHFISP